jgi:hypothetical protein
MASKRFWLLPVIILFVLLGLLAILAQTATVSPFLYTLF